MADQNVNVNDIHKMFSDALKTAFSAQQGFSEESLTQLRNLVTTGYAIEKGFASTEDAINKLFDKATSGKLSSKEIRKVSRELGYTVEQTEELFNISKKLDALGIEELKRFKDVNDAVDYLLDTEEARQKISSKLVDTYDEFNNLLKEQKKYYDSIGSSLGSNVDSMYKALSAKKELTKLFSFDVINTDEIESNLKNISESFNSFDGDTIEINGELKNKDEVIKSFKDISQTQIDLINQESKLREDKLKAYVAQMKGAVSLTSDTGENKLYSKTTGAEITGDEYSKISKSIDDISKKYEGFIKQIVSGTKLSEEQLKGMDSESYILIQMAAEAQKYLTATEGAVAAQTKNIDRLQVQYKLLKNITPQIEAAQTANEMFVDKLKELSSDLPPIISKFIGLDNAIEKISDQTKESFEVFKKSILEGKNLSTAIVDSFKSWSSIISKSIIPIGAISLLLVGMYRSAKMIGEEYNNIAEKIGISKAAAKGLFESNLKFLHSQKDNLSTAKELLEVQSSMVGEMGGQTIEINSDTGKELATRLNEISMYTGESVENTVKLYDTFEKLGADGKFSEQLIKQTSYMSEMAGISPRIITQDLIENAETISTYFAGMPEQAAKAAVNIRKMGLSIGQAGKIADRMMSSIGSMGGFMDDMYELQAMSNGKIDLSKAFDLGLSGDLEGMSKEVMSQIGTLKQFNEMTMFERKKLASTLGMSTDELEKSVMLEEKMKKLKGDDLEVALKNKDNLVDIAKLSDDEFKKRVKMLNPTQEMNIALEDIKDSFILALLPLAKQFSETITNLKPIIKVITAGFSGLATVVGFVLSVLGGAIEKITGAVNWIIKLFGGAKEEVKETGTQIAGVSKGVDVLSYGIGGLIGVFSVLKIGKKLFGSLSGSIKDAKDMLGGLKSVGEKSMDWVKEVPEKGKGIGGFFSKLFGGKKSVDQKSVVDTVQDVVSKTPLEKVKDVITESKPLDKVKDVITESKPVEKITKKAKERLRDAKGRFMKMPSAGKAEEMKVPDKKSSGGLSSFMESFSKIKPQQLLAGAASLAIVAGALFITAKALQQFNTVDWASLAKGGIALVMLTGSMAGLGAVMNKFQVELIQGAAAMVGMSAAVYVLAKALQQFVNVQWSDMLKGAAAIGGITLAMAGLGAVMSSGVGTVAILAGVAAFTAMGGAMFLLGKGMEAVGSAASNVEPLLKTLADMDTEKLLMIGPALMAISAGLMAITAGSIISGIGKLLTGDPFKKFEELAQMADPLKLVADAIQTIGSGLKDMAAGINGVDVKKLSDVSNIMMENNTGNKIPVLAPSVEPSKEKTAQNVSVSPTVVPQQKGATTKEDAINDYYNSKGSPSSGNDMTVLVNQMKIMINLLTEMNNRPLAFHFDDGVVRELAVRNRVMNNKG